MRIRFGAMSPGKRSAAEGRGKAAEGRGKAAEGRGKAAEGRGKAAGGGGRRASSDRRAAILDAAIAVIARRGVRGLRVEQVAAEAGVAVSLIYYYFDSRNGLVRATLEHANERAATRAADGGTASGRERAAASLLAELDDGGHVRDTSVVWGEVLASAVFEPALRDQLREASETWSALVSAAIAEGVADGSVGGDVDPRACAERLTALVDGLSARWLAGLISRERARELLGAAIASELGP
jgi:AcrR family transcriptional regulator